jgi:hypothetical protein
MEHRHLWNYNTQLVKVIKLKWLKDINLQKNIMYLTNMSIHYQNKRIKMQGSHITVVKGLLNSLTGRFALNFC